MKCGSTWEQVSISEKFIVFNRCCANDIRADPRISENVAAKFLLKKHSANTSMNT